MSGNNDTNDIRINSLFLGKMGNSIASTSRIFKHCNKNSNDLNSTYNCVFNRQNQQNSESHFNENDAVEIHSILDPTPISIDDIKDDLPEENEEISSKTILTGPFTPTQIKKAYSIPNILPSTNIRRSIVTIIAAFNNQFLARDITAFGRTFGLPTCNCTIYNFSRNFSVGWATEVTLNVQWVYAINPYANIRVILAASDSPRDMINAVRFANNKNNFTPAIDTDIMTMSWGARDVGNLSAYNNYFTNPKTIYFASSGNNNHVCVPSCCTNVISVGGTSLNINRSFNRLTERVWSKAGAGYSNSFNKPLHQPTILDNTGNRRMSPDLCCVADPNTPCFIIINNRAFSIGGTSLASPLCAGIFSLLTQNRLNSGRETYTSVLNMPNSIQPLLYDNNNSNCFFDVTEGTTTIYTAASGFDVASGKGVINLPNLLQKLG
jgi:subtilase family serine protease